MKIQEMQTSELLRTLVLGFATGEEKDAARAELDRRIQPPFRCQHMPHFRDSRVCMICGGFAGGGEYVYR